MKTCRQCGKEFDVLWPEIWAYKAGNPPAYFCSWKCLRANERKDGERMNKLTLENKKKAVEIAVNGGNPLSFIRECGVKNAAEAWAKIKGFVQKTDPEAYAKLPKRLPQEKAAKTERPAVQLVYDPGIAEEYRAEKHEEAVPADQLEVAAVYSRTVDSGTYKRYNGGMALCSPTVNIVMSAMEWFKFSQEILTALRQLDAGKPEDQAGGVPGMTTTQLIKRLKDLAEIGIVNAREDTTALLEAADRLFELRARAMPKWDRWLIMDEGLFLESISEDGETDWTKNKEDAMQFMPGDKETAETIADTVCGQVVLYGDHEAWPTEFIFESITTESDDDEGADAGDSGEQGVREVRETEDHGD